MLNQVTACCMLKMVLCCSKSKKVDDYIMKIGHVSCDMDTLYILSNTIMTHVNNSLKTIVHKNLFISKVYGNGDEMFSVTLADEDPNNVVDNNFPDYFSIPLPVKVTEDLAFLSTALGKENMSGHWCIWCELSPAQWAIEGHLQGEHWTFEKIFSLRQMIQELEQRGIKPEAAVIKGFTEQPLLDAVQIEDFIVPALHIAIGLGNHLFGGIFSFIKSRIEKLSTQMFAIRNMIYTAELNHKLAC
jgi:hypothetical protein